jgi:hypothetical protein
MRDVPMGAVRRARTYVGLRSAREKLRALMTEFRFVRMIDYVDALPAGQTGRTDT